MDAETEELFKSMFRYYGIEEHDLNAWVVAGWRYNVQNAAENLFTFLQVNQ